MLNESCLKGGAPQAGAPQAGAPQADAIQLTDKPSKPSNDDVEFGNKANGQRNKFNQPQEESVEEAVL